MTYRKSTTLVRSVRAHSSCLLEIGDEKGTQTERSTTKTDNCDCTQDRCNSQCRQQYNNRHPNRIPNKGGEQIPTTNEPPVDVLLLEHLFFSRAHQYWPVQHSYFPPTRSSSWSALVLGRKALEHFKYSLYRCPAQKPSVS